jgi:hypothetical protein
VRPTCVASSIHTPFASARISSVSLEGFINQRIRHALTSVDRKLPAAIDALRGWRDYLAHPIGCDCKRSGVGNRWKAIAAPAGQVGNDDIVAQMQFGFVENPPPSRITPTGVEWAADFNAEGARRARVPQRRSRRRVQFTAQDLRDQVVRNLEQVAVGRGLLEDCGCWHWRQHSRRPVLRKKVRPSENLADPRSDDANVIGLGEILALEQEGSPAVRASA